MSGDASADKQADDKETKFKCNFCNKAFSRERTLLSHVCEQKRRHDMRDQHHVRLGLRLFQIFYTDHLNSKVVKSFEDFRKSSYFLSFIRYAKFCIDTHVVNPEEFMSHLVKTRVRAERWPDDDLYMQWVKGYIVREHWERALPRTIEFIERWSRNRGKPLGDFFREVSDAELCYWIQLGLISPYIIFSCESARDRLVAMEQEQQDLALSTIGDPGYWAKIMGLKPEEMSNLASVLREYGF